MGHFKFDDAEIVIRVFMRYPPNSIPAFQSMLLQKLAVAQS
jgi:hypothetical protein